MATKIEDENLKKIQLLVEQAQAELDQTNLSYYKSIEKLKHSPPNDLPITHDANLKKIKQKYAKQISNECSKILE